MELARVQWECLRWNKDDLFVLEEIGEYGWERDIIYRLEWIQLEWNITIVYDRLSNKSVVVYSDSDWV